MDVVHEIGPTEATFGLNLVGDNQPEAELRARYFEAIDEFRQLVFNKGSLKGGVKVTLEDGIVKVNVDLDQDGQASLCLSLGAVETFRAFLEKVVPADETEQGR